MKALSENKRKARWLALSFGLVTAQLSAAPIQLVFENFEAGRIMDDEFIGQFGVEISAIKGTGTNPGFAVLYDTTGVLFPGDDPDLEGPPWDSGNAEFLIAGNALIVQENGPSAAEIAAGILLGPGGGNNIPDDNSGFDIILDYDLLQQGMQFDWADLDNDTSANIIFSNDTQTVTINFGQFTNNASPVFDPTIGFGDKSYDIVESLDLADITAIGRITAELGPMENFTGFDQIVFDSSVSGSLAFLQTDSFAGGYIGDQVFNDLDSDGVQDFGEPGIENVTIELFMDSNGNGTLEPGEEAAGPFRFMGTDRNGQYFFPGLPADDYLIRVSDDNNMIDGIATLGTDVGVTQAITLAVDQFLDTIDYGYAEPVGAIGDTVFNDLNGDGVFNAPEFGIELVSVDLYRDRGGPGDAPDGVFDPGFPNAPVDEFIGRIFTDPDGGYLYQGLDPDEYIVVVSDVNRVIEGSLTTGNEPAFVSIAANDEFFNIDFGYQEPTGSIGDLVFFDENGNGAQDVGEFGLQNVRVNLYRDLNNNSVFDSSDRLIDTDLTSQNGGYLFNGLEEGDSTNGMNGSGYIVQIDVSTIPFSNPILTLGTNPRILSLTAGQNFTDADFGFDGDLASIGELVFDDLNQDGILDGGEPGIPNVTVDLHRDVNGNGTVDPGDPRIRTTTTNGSGNYLFEDLVQDNYLVVASDRNLVINGPLTTPSNPILVMLTDIPVTDANFGFGRLGRIGDTVFNDIDGNGSQGGSEPGLPGVTVRLIQDLNMNGQIDGGEPAVRNLVTDSNGNYEFGGLDPDDYVVEVTDLNNVITGSQTNIVTIAGEFPVSLAAGQNFDTADFGYQQGSSVIGDTVYFDNDTNGVFSAGDTGIPNVTVDLILDVDDSGTLTAGDIVLRTETTDGSGNFSFTGLGADNYLVDVTNTNGVDIGTLVSPASEPVAVNLPAATTNNDVDFGYVQTGSISGLTFGDNNIDADFDAGEPLLQNVTVELYSDDNGDGMVNGPDALLQSTSTNAMGRYTFPGLPADDYTVLVTDTQNITSGILTPPQTNLRGITLAPDEDRNDVDFGFISADSEIGDLVFNDLNSNGTFDGMDSGIAGVTVALYRDNNNDGTIDMGDTLIATETTDQNGNYLFESLAADDYLVQVTDQNSILASTTPTGATSNPTDVTLPALNSFLDADFGFNQPTGSIGDSVFSDDNLDGIRQPGETGFANVGVNLIRDLNDNGILDAGDPIILTDLTDGNGNYEFTNLDSDLYFVQINDTNNVLAGLDTTNFAPTACVPLGNNQTLNNIDFGYTDCSAGSGNLEVIVSFEYGIINTDNFEANEVSQALAQFGSTTLANNPVLAPAPIGNLASQADGGTIPLTAFSQNLGNLAPGTYTLRLGGVLNQRTEDPELTDIRFDNVSVTAGGNSVRSDDFGSGVPAGYTFVDNAYSLANAEVSESSGDTVSGQLNINLGIGGLGGGNNDINTNGAWEVDIVVPAPPAAGGGEIGNRVWNDFNLNGVQDPGEPGISNVTIELYVDDNDNGIIDDTDTLAGVRTTGNDGIYLFQCLDPEDYLVTVTDVNNETRDLFLVNTVLPFPVTLAMDQSFQEADFGYGNNPVLFVELESLEAIVPKGTRTPLIRWVTSLEVDSIGFHLYQAELDGSDIVPGKRLTRYIIPSEGGSSEYTFIDSNEVEPNEWRAYFLEEIDLSGKKTLFGPVFVDTSKLFTPSGIDDFLLYE